MVKHRKAQAAMEFLMTYGWAILVVLIVIGALAYFGVLNPQQFLPRKCQFSQGVVCADHTLTASPANLNLKLSNGLGNDIDIGAFNYTSDNGQVVCGVADAATVLLAGADAVITLPCAPMTATSGARVKGSMVFAYTDLQSNFNHTMTGTLLTDVE